MNRIEQKTLYVEIPAIQPSPVLGRRDGAIGPSVQDLETGRSGNLIERLRRSSPVVAGLLAVDLLAAACGNSNDAKIASATTTPAASLGTVPSSEPQRIIDITPPPAQKSPDVKTQQTTEAYTLLSIESRKWAADNLGADEYSKNPDNWDDPVVTKEGDKFIHLKQRPNEVHTRVKMTDKTVGQSWIKIKTTDSGIERFVGNQVLDAQAEVLVLSPRVEADVKEITVRMADNVDALLKDSLNKMVAKEAAEQPGVPVVLICPPSEITAKGAVGSYSLLDIPTSQGSAEQWAAENFGVKGDGWSDKASSWEIKVTPEGDKFAHLKQRPNEVHSEIKTTDNAVGQAWAKIKRTDSGVETINGNKVTNAQAEAFVVLPNVQMKVKEITIRLSNNVAALAVDSFNKLFAKEAAEQPEVKVLIACPVLVTPGGKGATGTQGPSIKGGGEPAPIPTPTPTAAPYVQRA